MSSNPGRIQACISVIRRVEEARKYNNTPYRSVNISRYEYRSLFHTGINYRTCQGDSGRVRINGVTCLIVQFDARGSEA